MYRINTSSYTATWGFILSTQKCCFVLNNLTENFLKHVITELRERKKYVEIKGQ